ncbi:MAG: 23S rRNA (pseudouridine(1915)-N(3))-methyltransferase RlmH [Rhizobiaceae bacterium]
MLLSIHAIGRLKTGPERELYQRYEDRLKKAGRNIGISGLSLKEYNDSRSDDSAKRREQEADTLLSGLGGGATLIALDENGRDLSSNELSQFLRKMLHSGTQQTAFAIGGPDGHGNQLLENADMKLRFGSMTWPHQMVRIMLVEQLYRSVTILSGHPYHRN